MPAYVVKSRQAWLEQANRAFDALSARAPAGAELRDLDAVDHQQFCELIEALYALGVNLAPEVRALAQLGPVEDVLGLP